MREHAANSHTLAQGQARGQKAPFKPKEIWAIRGPPANGEPRAGTGTVRPRLASKLTTHWRLPNKPTYNINGGFAD